MKGLELRARYEAGERSFPHANLYGADLCNANLRGADLSSANLRGADLSSAHLWGANLYGADLWGANLSNADLCSANLSSANLSSANLWGADLYDANLQGAIIGGADLHSADLTNADLCNADLSSAALVHCAGVTYACLGVYQLTRVGGTTPMIHAGCRWYTVEEAHKHWAPGNESQWTFKTAEYGESMRKMLAFLCD